MKAKQDPRTNFLFEGFHDDRVVELCKQSEYRRNRTVYIDDEIDTSVSLRVEYMLEQLARFDLEDGKNPIDCDPIILKINSPGGDVYSSMSIVSCVESLKQQGFTIHTFAQGMAMSGAFKIFIAGSKRLCRRWTHFMCHQPNQFEYGFASYIDQERKAEVMREIWGKLKDIVCSYTKIALSQLDDITEKNKDWYFWAEEAVSLGVVDEII